MNTDQVACLIEGCERALESAGGFKWRAIKLIEALRESQREIAVADGARRHAQQCGTELVMKNRDLQAQLAACKK